MTPERRLELDISMRGEPGAPTAEMRVIGEFDRLQVERFDDAATALTRNLTRLTIDLTMTTIIDSAALGSLVRLRRATDTMGCELVVLVSRPFQVTVMKVGGLYDHLGVREV